MLLFVLLLSNAFHLGTYLVQRIKVLKLITQERGTMSEYIAILLWLMLVAFMASKKSVKQYELVNDRVVRRCRMWFAVLAFLPIIWMVGNRTLWFGDTGMYHDSFYAMPSSISELPSYLPLVRKDKGFAVLSVTIKMLFGADHTIYFLVLAVIQSYFLITVYRKYSLDYIFSIVLFIISTDYVAWMYNGIRQFTAVTMIFGATTLMLKKKWLALVAIILLASTIHQSALLMIPLVFICSGKAWNRKTLIFIAVALLAVVFVGQFTNLLDTALAETQYVNVVSDYKELSDDGTNPLRVLIYSVPAILSFVGRDTIRRKNDSLVNLCTNMSIVSMGLYVVSMFTSGVFLGRLPIYVSLYGYILLPWEVEHLFSRESKRFIFLGIIGMYLLFYYYQMHFAWGLL